MAYANGASVDIRFKPEPFKTTFSIKNKNRVSGKGNIAMTNNKNHRASRFYSSLLFSGIVIQRAPPPPRDSSLPSIVTTAFL